MFSNKPRSFNPSWCTSYPWLEYFVEKDEWFCYPCYVFGGHTSCYRPEQAFTITGLKNWKHAMGKKGILIGHNACHPHRQATLAWNQYTLNVQRGTCIAEQMSSARSDKINRNRHYLNLLLKFFFNAVTRKLFCMVTESMNFQLQTREISWESSN